MNLYTQLTEDGSVGTVSERDAAMLGQSWSVGIFNRYFLRSTNPGIQISLPF